MKIDGKTILVTGGAQGIGKAIVSGFARTKAHLFFLDIDQEAGEETASELRSHGASVDFIPCDLSSSESIKTAIEKVLSLSSRIDVLVNNAGVGDWKGIVQRTEEEWDRIIDINLRAPYLSVKYTLSAMPEGSAVINISSTRALMSEKNSEPYSASKAGLLGLTHSLAVSLAERKIRVNCISPGWIDVSAWQKQSKRNPVILREVDHLQHPAGRVGRPEDIAELCLFLADNEKSGFITGQNFICDGGMTKKMIYVEDEK